MESELYSQCVEEATALLGRKAVSSDMLRLYDVFTPTQRYLSSLPELNQEFLNWLKNKVNEQAFNAEGVTDTNAQGKMEL